MSALVCWLPRGVQVSHVVSHVSHIGKKREERHPLSDENAAGSSIASARAILSPPSPLGIRKRRPWRGLASGVGGARGGSLRAWPPAAPSKKKSTKRGKKNSSPSKSSQRRECRVPRRKGRLRRYMHPRNAPDRCPPLLCIDTCVHFHARPRTALLAGACRTEITKKQKMGRCFSF